MIQHFILTRSCYRQTDLKYLRYRFRMMQQFCGASLALQSQKDFAWVVRCNPDSPLADEYAEYFQSLPFPVISIGSQPPAKDASDTIATADSVWASAIKDALLPETTHVLTTRIDDDDLLAPCFVKRLRRKAKPSKEPIAYNFPVGYVLNLSTAVGSKARRWRFPRNQFASLLSPVKPLVLVNDAKHGDIETLGRLVLIDPKPAFVWTRHPLTKSAGGRFKADIPVRNLVKTFPALAGVK